MATAVGNILGSARASVVWAWSCRARLEDAFLPLQLESQQTIDVATGCTNSRNSPSIDTDGEHAPMENFYPAIFYAGSMALGAASFTPLARLSKGILITGVKQNQATLRAN